MVPCTTISTSYAIPLHRPACVARKTSVQELDKAQEEDEACEDVQLLSVSAVNRPSIALQQLGCVRHTVDGDGNCLFYAIAHQAGLIKQGCHGDRSVADQLRTLALICMQKYPDVRVEDGITLCQWEQKKFHIVQRTQWGGDLEIRLLAIGIKREIVVITASGNDVTSARRFSCHPSPIPKMRGGIFIPVDVAELSTQLKYYNPHPLLIIYNGINHYDSAIFINN